METSEQNCWCDSGEIVASCCGPLLSGQLPAPTAVALMRSRYSAYVTHNHQYLLDTWAPETRPSQIQFDQHQRWLGLKIRRVEAGANGDSHGLVEFVARFKVDGRGHRLHEISSFRRSENSWVYVDGELVLKPTPG